MPAPSGPTISTIATPLWRSNFHAKVKEWAQEVESEASLARFELLIALLDLDEVISQLSLSPAQDQLQLQRLKKRKLFLKDQITLLERQLTPDIPA